MKLPIVRLTPIEVKLPRARPQERSEPPKADSRTSGGVRRVRSIFIGSIVLMAACFLIYASSRAQPHEEVEFRESKKLGWDTGYQRQEWVLGLSYAFGGVAVASGLWLLIRSAVKSGK